MISANRGDGLFVKKVPRVHARGRGYCSSWMRWLQSLPRLAWPQVWRMPGLRRLLPVLGTVPLVVNSVIYRRATSPPATTQPSLRLLRAPEFLLI